MYMQGFLLIFNFILSKQQPRAFDGIELIKNVGNSLCPYTNYCHTNASGEYIADGADRMPTCLSCSCDDECWLLDSCCPDKEETTEHPLTIPCKRSQVKGDSDFRLEDILKQRAGADYRVIDECPPYETNGTLLQKCHGGENLSNRSLSEYIWVSDSTTGKIYQNIYCIECYGIEQFWYWMIQTSCKEILDADVDAETLISMDCDIINVLPDSKAALVAKYQCFDYNLEYFDLNCNMTAELNYDFATACKRSTWPYLAASGRVSIFLYKNVFCFACQFGIAAIKHEIDIGGRVGPVPSFSALLNYQAIRDGSKNTREQTCHSSQVADPYTNTCYELLCPFGKYPWYGECKKKFSGLKRVCLCAILYVEVLLDHTMQHMDNDTLDHYLYDAMQEVLTHTLKIAKWNETNCEVDTAYIARTRNKDELYPAYNVSLSIVIKESCDLYDIPENIMNHQLGGTTVKLINDTIMDLNIKINVKDKDDEEGFNTCYYRCFEVMRLDSDIVCPQIELTFSDAERFSPEQKSERAAFLSFFDSEMTPNRRATVWVCLEDYVKIMSTSNGDYRSTAYLTVALLLILLISLSLI